MKSKSFMLMILSLGFGLIAAIGISQVLGRNQANATPVIKMGSVVVAADHLDSKTFLTEENVKIENWPANIIPEDAVTTIDEITDMAINTRLSKGMPIVKSTITNKAKMGTLAIPDGFKVVAIKVSAEELIGGLLEPGDKVDVIGLFKLTGRDNTRKTTARTFLKALRVFSVNNKMTASDNRAESGSSSSAIVSLLVTEKQSEEIYFVQRTGSLKLVLRGDFVETDSEVESLADIMNIKDEDETGDLDDEIEADIPVFTSPVNVQPMKQSEMIVWQGNTPERIVFQSGGLPQLMGSAPREIVDLDDQEVGEDEEDADASNEIDRSLEQDQYRGE